MNLFKMIFSFFSCSTWVLNPDRIKKIWRSEKMKNEKTQNENIAYSYIDLCTPEINKPLSENVFNFISNGFNWNWNKPKISLSVPDQTRPLNTEWNTENIKPFEDAVYSIPKLLTQKYLKDKQIFFNECIQTLKGFNILGFNIHFLSNITQEHKQNKKGLFDDLIGEELNLSTKTTENELTQIKNLLKNSNVLNRVYNKAIFSLNPEIKPLFCNVSYLIKGV